MKTCLFFDPPIHPNWARLRWCWMHQGVPTDLLLDRPFCRVFVGGLCVLRRLLLWQLDRRCPVWLCPFEVAPSVSASHVPLAVSCGQLDRPSVSGEPLLHLLQHIRLPRGYPHRRGGITCPVVTWDQTRYACVYARVRVCVVDLYRMVQ